MRRVIPAAAALLLCAGTLSAFHNAGRPFTTGAIGGAEAPPYVGRPEAPPHVGRPFRAGAISSQDDPRRGFHAAVDPAIDAIWAGYDSAAAMGHVRFISQYWRLAANPGYNATVDRIRERLTAAGLAVKVEEYPAGGPAWDHSMATLAIVGTGGADEVVLSRDKDRLALCINSFSTPGAGLVAPLVDVGRGDRDEDYAGKTIKGAVVLGDVDAGQLWRRAVTAQGAIGVLSTSLPAYLNADPPGAKPTPRDQWDILQWGSVPYDEARKAFGFKASPRAASTLRKRLAAAGAKGVSVRVTIASSFSTGPARTLVAEIPGTAAAAERIVMAAHIQEPGANDNASGVATLAELAASMSAAIRQKKIAAPARTLTFLFLNEISGSRRWLQDHPDDAKQVKYMFSLDMTGEDVTKTGGTFLIERYPDPGAVWERRWDPHTEWGKGTVRAESLKGDLINDAHFAVVERVARKGKWVVKTNPYEGGSDHTVFGQAGIPSLLDWHFTDRYYHTNFDTPDKTSPEEMRNVGVAVGATGWLFASASESVALEVAKIVAAAGRDRIAVEEREGAKLAATASDSAAARARETTILAAWRKWYGEAVRSATRLVTGASTPAFNEQLNRIAVSFDAAKAGGLGAGIPLWLGWSAAEYAPQQAGAAIIGNQPLSSEVFSCGSDQELPNPIPLVPAMLILAGDGRLYSPCRGMHTEKHREAREISVLSASLHSKDPELRWRASQAVARMPRFLAGEIVVTGRGPNWLSGTFIQLEDNLGDLTKLPVVSGACGPVQIFGGIVDPLRWQPGRLFRLLQDSSPAVQKEAAYAIGTRLTAPGRNADVITAAFNEIQSCLKRSPAELPDDVRGLLFEAVGVAAYATDEQRAAAEAFLVDQPLSSIDRVLGVARGLEALVRQNPRRAIQDTTRERLRQLTVFGRGAGQPVTNAASTTVRFLAVQALITAGDSDTAFIRRAADDDDWQVRRLVAARLDLSNADQAAVGDILARDPAFQVRYDFLSAAGRHATRTRKCAPIAAFLKDAAPVVVMRAMDVLVDTCTDLDVPIAFLIEAADTLGEPASGVGQFSWHVPARALTALARLKPEDAKSRLDAALKHGAWEVRATVAAVAATLADEATAGALARDPHPNVRTAALDALSRMKSASVVPQAIAALQDGEDFQLLMTAARVLKGLPPEAKDLATEALLGALRRLTQAASDMSRDPRVAILDRLAETMPPARSADLLPYAGDFDDEVGKAASRAFAAIVGAPPADLAKSRRYPYQPAEAALRALPSTAEIRLENGVVQLRFLPDVAPVTIARFAELAASGAYNGKTLHRIVPNFVVQGGSPAANEYAGATPRFMRDEVGPQARHLRGAVGISTRGDDTGDGQIFIDLVDLPRLDRHYTVFAYVTSGMEFVDRMLEGATIKSVTVR